MMVIKILPETGGMWMGSLRPPVGDMRDNKNNKNPKGLLFLSFYYSLLFYLFIMVSGLLSLVTL